ncbi:MAG: 2OG-Fe(II) oxygenase [Gammaproteobacteria bacterium]|nr:2OG-Fe(II) oxygenase [Gammaproteobacteria bacterium]
MINMDSIKNSKLIKSPFRYAVIANCLHQNAANKLFSDLPKENNYRSLRETGSDKTYNVVNNLLLKLGDANAHERNHLTPCWLDLTNQLQTGEYISSLSQLLEEDLSSCHLEITLKRYGYDDYISTHTDKEQVRATHMIFLNPTWDEQWGGQLCFKYDEHIIFKKFLPISAHSVAFVRATNSWHAVEKIVKPDIERIAVQVAFWNKTNREVLPGRVEEIV